MTPAVKRQIAAAARAVPWSAASRRLERTGSRADALAVIAVIGRRRPPRRADVEAQLQRAVAEYLDVALPADAVWTAIGHGGGGKTRGAILKGMGVKAGMPDIMIIWRGQVIFIELKAGRGGLSRAQKAFHDRLYLAGASITVCRCLSDVHVFLGTRGVPLRARVAV